MSNLIQVTDERSPWYGDFFIRHPNGDVEGPFPSDPAPPPAPVSRRPNWLESFVILLISSIWDLTRYNLRKQRRVRSKKDRRLDYQLFTWW